MPDKNKILCIEDDQTMQSLVAASLPGFEIIIADTLAKAEKILSGNKFAAILVDIHLPDGDGLRFLTEMLKNPLHQKTPSFVLSSHDEIANKVMAFTFGAEDFIAKPFDPIELQTRVTSKIRRSQNEIYETNVRLIGKAKIDLDRQKVFFVNEGNEIDLGLTTIELKIFALLTKRLERVFSRDEIIDQVWGSIAITDRTVDSHVAHLRVKISDTGVFLETVKGMGYRATLNSENKNDLEK